MLRAACLVALLVLLAASARLAQVDLGRLIEGLPKLGHWLATAWPPKLDEVPIFLWRTAETVAMAAVGTAIATLLAVPMALLASRNLTPWPRLVLPARWLLNALRGIDAFVFALLFVAEVGMLGVFAAGRIINPRTARSQGSTPNNRNHRSHFQASPYQK